MNQIKGRASIEYEAPPKIIGAASIVGSKEGDGPLNAAALPLFRTNLRFLYGGESNDETNHSLWNIRGK